MSKLVWITYFLVCIADVLVNRYEPAWHETWDFYYGISFVLFAVMVVAWHLAHRDWQIAGAWLFWTIVGFWMWWSNTRNRKRRKRMADRASGIVVDVGGRLKVVRDPLPEH